jgi:hypothetical protein
MAHTPYREKLAATFLNLFDKEERCVFSQHLAICPSCEIGLSACRANIDLLLRVVKPIEPPSHLRAHLIERIKRLEMDLMYRA